jgi:hypothetical protein
MEAQAAGGEKPFIRAHDLLDRLTDRLTDGEVMAMPHDAVERLIDVEGRKVLRTLYEDHLRLRSLAVPVTPVVASDGNCRTHVRPHRRKLESVFGTVEFERQGFGGRGLESLHPVDAGLNLPPEKYSLLLRRLVAEEAARGSFEEAIGVLGRYTAGRVPLRQAEELVLRAAQDFDGFYSSRELLASEECCGGVLVLTFDGKGVPMRKVDLREDTKKAAEQRERKLAHRRTKGEKASCKRMSTVAAVYTVAPFVRRPEDVIGEICHVRAVSATRPRPEAKRVWASLVDEPEEVMRQAIREGLRRDPERKKTWVAMVDGDPKQLRHLRKLAKEFDLRLTIILDFIHVAEYLWRAAYVFHEEATKEAEAWVMDRLLKVLRGEASNVMAGIAQSATKRELSATARKPVDRCCNYLRKNLRYLRYGECLGRGLPIATGVIEGACRYLVKDRMEVTGARWRLGGAEAVLRLRALRASQDFDAYWAYHLEQENRRNHRRLYADDTPPELVLPRSTGRPALRLVK